MTGDDYKIKESERKRKDVKKPSVIVKRKLLNIRDYRCGACGSELGFSEGNKAVCCKRCGCLLWKVGKE